MPDSFRPVSPGYAGTRSQSYYFQLALYAGGNVLAVAICLLLWFCWDVLSAFQEPLVWSYLCSLSLRDVKRYLVNTARRELQTSSFVVCCAKLVFLPAVIIWQLFEELRDKLQSKYHELQQKKQGTSTTAAPSTATDSRRSSKYAVNPLFVDDSTDSSDSESKQQQDCKASAGTGMGAAAGLRGEGAAIGNGVLQQGLRQRKPPLVPKPAAAAKDNSSRKARCSGGARQHLPASMNTGKAGKVAAQAGSTSAGKPFAGKGAVAAAATAKAASHSRSNVQKRLRRFKHVAVRQLKWYWFCLVELLKFMLGGLWPQQQKPQLQQQQQQPLKLLLTPAVSSRAGRLSSPAGYSSPVAVANGSFAAAGGFEQYAGTPMRVSASSSIGSSGMSEHGAWTPQQQQQMWQQQQQRRLSTSHSSPSLALLRQLQGDKATGSSTAAVIHSVSQDEQQRLLQQHVSMDDSVLLSTSFAGWAAAQQQQQQQCEMHSRSSSIAAASVSSSSSTKAVPAAATTGSAPSSPVVTPAAVAAAVGAGPSSDDYTMHASSAVTPRGLAHDVKSTLSPSRAYSAAVPVAAYCGDLGSTPAAAPAKLASTTSSMSFGAGASFGSPWEGFIGSGHEGLVGLTTGAPTTPSSDVMGLSSSGSPSNILFKWLLRGIVLYEGWRYGQSFWDPDQPMFVLLLLLGGTLAVAFGLPVLLLPSLLWRSPLADHAEQSREGETDAAAPDGSSSSSTHRKRQPSGKAKRSPFEQQQQQHCQSNPSTAADRTLVDSSSSSSSSNWPVQSLVQAVWSLVTDLLVRADVALRSFCSSSFLDTAVSGLIVVGLILGSVVLSVVLLFQVGEESRQAVLHMNTLVRQKVDSEGTLRQGVRSLLQEYEGQVTTMLRDSLPSVTQYVESRAVEFLVSHNLSRVLLDLETVKAALHLPGDCSEEAKIQLAVQLANSSLAVQELGQQREQLQQQLDAEQRLVSTLAAQYEALQIRGGTNDPRSTRRYDGSTGSTTGCDDTPSMPARGPAAAAAAGAMQQDLASAHEVAHALLGSQQRLAAVQEALHGIGSNYDAASEQLQLAHLRLHNCHPEATAAAAAAGHGRSFSGFLSSFWPHAGPAVPADTQTLNYSSSGAGPGAQLRHVSDGVSHLRKMLSALTRFDFGVVSSEAAGALGHLFPDHSQQQQQQEVEEACSTTAAAVQEGNIGYMSQFQQELSFPPAAAVVDDSVCADGAECITQQQQQQCSRRSCGSGNTSCSSVSSNSSIVPAAPVAAAVPTGSSSSSSSNGAVATGSIMRVAKGAAYPLITSMQTMGSVFLTGVGSTTAVALGTGLGVLRLGLGVMKFLVQLGVFASVLYTLLALDIDPVEQLVRLLPMSEASQDRASHAVTKAMRGVFVSSLKLAAFHAGFTWLTLRAFHTHFVCLAAAASAVVAVLPLVPVALVALPAVLELVLLRGAPVKGFMLAALHLGAYYFGDDLIFREVEPTLPYLVGLGVFGGMYTFKNPLQGVLLGPMVLALLSVGYNLHRALY